MRQPPVWCPHKDCKPLTSFKEICCGRLPKPEPHGNDFNTHRICLNGAGDTGGVFDLQVCNTDLFWFGLLFKAIRKDLVNGSK